MHCCYYYQIIKNQSLKWNFILTTQTTLTTSEGFLMFSGGRERCIGNRWVKVSLRFWIVLDWLRALNTCWSCGNVDVYPFLVFSNLPCPIGYRNRCFLVALWHLIVGIFALCGENSEDSVVAVPLWRAIFIVWTPNPPPPPPPPPPPSSWIFCKKGIQNFPMRREGF